jgi:S-adenosylmethionine-diacylgycerolhomoserine-N-methlytransferase
MPLAASGAEQMDSIYHTQRHFYDFTRKYYLLGRDRMIAALRPPPKGTILEIGCGTGRNLIAAARAWPQARLYGLDISRAMLETAQRSVDRADLRRVMLVQGDATGFDAYKSFGLAAFDRIFFSYTLSMIPGWERAVEAAIDALGPGGAIHIVDFGQQEQLPNWWRRLLFVWLARFSVEPRAELYPQLAHLAEARGLILDFVPLYRGYAWSAVLRRPKALS